MSDCDYPTVCFTEECPNHDNSASGCREHSRHYVSLCEGFSARPRPDRGQKCFGIGCPMRNECARFTDKVLNKYASYIQERYDFVVMECENMIERAKEPTE